MWLVTCCACACVYVEGSRVGCCCEVVRLVGVSKIGNMAQKTMMRTLSVEKNVIDPELAECGDLDVLSLSLSFGRGMHGPDRGHVRGTTALL